MSDIIKATSLNFARFVILSLLWTLAPRHCLAATVRAASTNVSCGPDRVSELIAAIHTVNATPGADTLNLAPGCIYTLTEVNNEADGSNGLPSVTGEIAIEGHGATIERAEDAPDLRIFHVAPGGQLTLNDVMLRSGSLEYGDGGAIYNARSGTVRFNGCTV